MYIMGNAPQLAARSPKWEKIIDELSESESIGNGWPIACARHPETRRFAKKPGDIQQLSPDGEFSLVLFVTILTGNRRMPPPMVR